MSVKQALQTFKNAAIDLAIEAAITVLEPKIPAHIRKANAVKFALNNEIPVVHALHHYPVYDDFYEMGATPRVFVEDVCEREPNVVSITCASTNVIEVFVHGGAQ